MIICKFRDMNLVNKYKEYISSFLKQEITLVKLNPKELKAIPLVVGSNYDFYFTDLFGHKVVLLFSKYGDELTPMQIEKHVQLISKTLNMVAVAVFESLVSYNITRLTKRQVNFVVPWKQIFVPEIMISIHKEPAIQREVKLIPPMAQVLILWQLERGGLEGLTTCEIAKRIGATQATMYRSISWLAKNELIQMRGEKEKVLYFCAQGKDLWMKVKDVCVSPIERVVYTDSIINGLKSGTEALAELTMLNYDGKRVIALTKAEVKSSGILVDSRYGDTCIEIWRYNPKTLAKNGCVDPLSLYLSMVGNEDDRIQIELEHLIENIIW